ncbi:MAG: 2,4-dihydroxyhept-2-ene-1,7-dioic acid aldolase [Gammaproteobacteria bacterium]|nr:MAG: 2,4-dihydroxyhept-2-ene-1,7-dioic acid aldolase [Gammaproteobacteria bacterium]
MNADFRRRLLAGERLVGTLLTLPDPAVPELMRHLGYDWLFIDCEHGPFEAQQAQAMLQGAHPLPCLVRVPSSDPVWLKKMLDIGPAGVIVPQVNSPQQAAAVVAACRYPPRGERGIGVGRAHGFGPGFQDYLRNANEAVSVVVQAEHIEAVRNIEAIADVPGIDCILVGPNDLAASMGRIGELDHPDVKAAIARVRDCCRARGIPLGCFGVTREAIREFIDQGFCLITVGVDVLYLGQAAGEMLAAVREMGDGR